MHRRPVERHHSRRLSGAKATCGTPLALSAALMGLGMSHTMAAGADGAQRDMALEPTVAVMQTLTDNHDASARGESDAITRLTAGVGFRARSGAVRGFLDYSLSSVLYARHSDRNTLQNALNANLAADLIDNRLQLVTAANISRSAISAFGVQPGSGSDGNANTTEVRSLRIAPTLRGPLGPAMRYTASVAHTLTSTVDSGLGDASSTSATVRLEPSDFARLGWSVDASHLESAFKQGRKTQTDRLSGGLRWNVDDLDLQFSATGGAERTNLSSLDQRSYSNWGVGLSWSPSPVTKLSVDLEDRFFGRSYALSLERRTPRTIFRVRSARSLSTTGTQAFGVQGPAADLFNSLLQSRFPDAAERERAVNAILKFEGISDPNTIISTGFLQSAATVQDLQEVSAAWTGQRDVAMVTLSRSKTRRADRFASVLDDLSQTDTVVLSSLALNLSHRLNAQSSLALTLSTQRAKGDASLQSSRRTSADLLLVTQLTPESSASVLLRRAQFRTGLFPYEENALVATYGLRF